MWPVTYAAEAARGLNPNTGSHAGRGPAAASPGYPGREPAKQGPEILLPNMGQRQCKAFWFSKIYPDPLLLPNTLEMGSVLIPSLLG